YRLLQGSVLAAAIASSTVPTTSTTSAPAIATTPTTSAPAASILARLGLVNRQAPPTRVLVIQRIHSRSCVGVIGHFDKAKPAAPTCLSVYNHLGASHFAERGKQVFKIGISD